ncbi:MAG: glycosyltransferase family 61 protein, partial [Bacteroidota bacterium]
VVVNSQMAPFQRDTLELLGIPKKKIVQSDWQPFIQADELVVPSLPDYVNIASTVFLRQELLTFPRKKVKATKKIYISRSRAGHRRVCNEATLREMLEKRGFQTVHFERMPFREQVNLMQESKWVIGPHGAGLTNLVFAQPGTKVIELIHPKAVKRLFWSLSELMHLSYHYFFAEGELIPPGQDSYLNSEDLEIDIHKLSQMLDQVQADT